MEVQETLQLESTCLFRNQAGSVQYGLFGMVVHSGSLDSGHYVAYVLHGDQWFYFSDSRFQAVTTQRVLQA